MTTPTPRSRSRTDGPTTVPVTRYINGNPNGTVNTVMHHTEETMDDYVTPGFRRLMRAGEIVNNPCTYVKSSEDSTPGGSMYIEQSGVTYVIEGGDGSMSQCVRYIYGSPWDPGIGPAPPTAPTNLVERTKADALGNVDRSPYSFAEDLAEMRETLRFLRDPLASIRNLSKSFSDDVGDLLGKKKALDRAKAIADVWLTYQFAFSPLVRSANDLIESFSAIDRTSPRKVARGFASWDDTVTESALARGAFAWDGTSKTEVSVTSGILYEVSNPLQGWRDKYGLRFKDIPETLWAIFPYSFMVDRAFNLSTALRGAVSFLDPNVKMLAGWTTSKTTTSRSMSFMDYTYPSASSVSVTPNVITQKDFEYDRSVWIPELADLIPPLRIEEVGNSATKAADIVALILQRLR